MQWISNNLPNKFNQGISIRVIRYAIPIAVIMLSLLLARQPSKMFILLPIGAAAGLIILRYPKIGILGIVPISLLWVLDFQRDPSAAKINTTILYAAFVIGLWFFDMVVNQRQVKLISSRAVLALSLFCISVLISFVVGQLPWFVFGQKAELQAQIGQLTIFLLSAGVFLVAAHQIKDIRILKAITWIFLGISGVYLFLRIVPSLGVYVAYFINPGATGSVFWVWLLSMSFSQAVYNRKLKLHWRVLLGIVTIATIYAGFVQSRSWSSGWLPPLISLIVILLVVDVRFGIVAGLTGLLIAYPKIQEIFGELTTGSEAYSYFTRVEAWRIVLQLLRENWLLGLGPANYYWYTPLLPILGYAVNFNSHNQYIDILAQVGVVGLLLFLWFAWEVGRTSWKMKSILPDGFSKAYCYGAIGGIAGMLVAGMLGDWLIPFIYNVGTVGFRASLIGWLFMGGTLALYQIYKNDPSQLETPSEEVSPT